MVAVIFEVTPRATGYDAYLAIAAELRHHLEGRPGFISVERFTSLTEEGKLLSLSFWESEEAIAAWRTHLEHRLAQKTGREQLFAGYRIRVAAVVRDYTETARDEAPADSRRELG